MTVLSIPQTTILSYKKICHLYVTGRAIGRWNLINPSAIDVLRMSHKKQSIGTCYYLQDTPLEMSTKKKYLGVDLSNDLDWSHHINSITSTANKTFGLLCHNLKSCSPYIENIS